MRQRKSANIYNTYLSGNKSEQSLVSDTAFNFPESFVLSFCVYVHIFISPSSYVRESPSTPRLCLRLLAHFLSRTKRHFGTSTHNSPQNRYHPHVPSSTPAALDRCRRVLFSVFGSCFTARSRFEINLRRLCVISDLTNVDRVKMDGQRRGLLSPSKNNGVPK